MKIRATKYLLGLIAGLFIFTACEDDFSEEDLLNLQADLAETKAANDHTRELAILAQELADALALSAADAAEAEAYRAAVEQASYDLQTYLETLEDTERAEAEALLAAAGMIGSYTITVSSNESFVSDAIVAIRGGANTQDTTDANGQVVFLDVLVGQSYVDVSSAAHMGISYTIDFGEPESNLSYVDGHQITNLDLGSTAVQLIENSASSAYHTFRGTVYAQTSLIEDVDGSNPDEVLADIPVMAVLQSDNDATGSTSSFYYVYSTDGNTGVIRDVSFNGDGFKTTDSTDASGNYEIMVPVFEESPLTWQIQFPATVSGTQYVAGVVSDSVEVFGINTTWGLGYAGDAAESVQGYAVSTNDPATQGSGLALGSWAQVGRSLTDLSLTTDWENALNGGIADDERVYLNGTGSDIVVSHNRQTTGFTTTPSVAVGGNGTGDTDADIDAELTWDFGDVDITASDAGRYTNFADFEIYLYVIGYLQSSPSNVDTLRYLVGTPTADGTGLLAASTIDLGAIGTVTAEISDDAGGWTTIGLAENPGNVDIEANYDFDVTSYEAAGFIVTGSDNNVGVTSTVGLSGTSSSNITWDMEGGGTGYVGTPTFEFTGSSDDLEVLVFPTQYSFVLDNSASSGYTVLPTNISFSGDRYTTTDVNITESSSREGVDSYNGTTAVSTTGAGGLNDLQSFLTISGDTIIAQNSTVTTFRTDDYFVSTPSMDAVEDDFENPDVTLTFGNVPQDGALTAATSTAGNGYSTQITFSLIGRPVRATALAGFTTTPTTAAVLTSAIGDYQNDTRTGELIWNTTTLTREENGEGYRVELNDTSNPAAITTVNFNVGTSTDGGTTVQNMDYGYGERDSTPAGDN